MITVNTNTASSLAAYNVGSTNAQLQKSLQRLSSGSRINNSSDDAGGLAVSMKLSAAIRRTEATQSNVNNAIAFLQTQDGVMKNADKILNRIAELTQLATDVTKTTTDTALYQTEADALIDQLAAMEDEQFNGQDLFGTTQLTVVTSQDGTQEIDIDRADFSDLSGLTVDFSSHTNAADDVTAVTDLIQTLAELRATNGAQQSRLTFAADTLAINKVNLESANGRIADVDIAAESANLARLNILQQAGTAMLAQANQSPQSLLALLT
jgi:flagellin